MQGSKQSTLVDSALQEAVRLLGIYTAGRYWVWDLMGPSKASCRAHVMSALAGKRMPQSKSGVTALQSEFYSRAQSAGLSFDDADCNSVREDRFVEWCKGGAA